MGGAVPHFALTTMSLFLERLGAGRHSGAHLRSARFRVLSVVRVLSHSVRTIQAIHAALCLDSESSSSIPFPPDPIHQSNLVARPSRARDSVGSSTLRCPTSGRDGIGEVGSSG